MKKTRRSIKQVVKSSYAKIAETSSCCCAGSCGKSDNTARSISRKIGYNPADMDAAPEDANMGLGCGNPVALASLKPGDVVFLTSDAERALMFSLLQKRWGDTAA